LLKNLSVAEKISNHIVFVLALGPNSYTPADLDIANWTKEAFKSVKDVNVIRTYLPSLSDKPSKESADEAKLRIKSILDQ